MFTFLVCRVAWIARRCASERVVFGAHRVIVDGFDRRSIEERMRRRVEATHGEDCCEIAAKLARVAAWELDGCDASRGAVRRSRRAVTPSGSVPGDVVPLSCPRP